MSCPSPRLLLVASARRCARGGALLAVVGGGGAQVGVVQACAGEVALLAGGLVAVVGLHALADDVEHEQRVDDPDRRGRSRGRGRTSTRSGRWRRGRAVSASTWSLSARVRALRGERVELAVELVRRRSRAGSAACGAGGGGELRAGALELLGGVEQRAVVDPHGVHRLVLDDGAVHERAEVDERALVQLGLSDARRRRRW